MRSPCMCEGIPQHDIFCKYIWDKENHAGLFNEHLSSPEMKEMIDKISIEVGKEGCNEKIIDERAVLPPKKQVRYFFHTRELPVFYVSCD